MTVIRPNSVSGINSITAQADEIKVFKSNGTQGGLIIGGANLNATSGISTLLALNVTGNVSIAGTLTYQDVTNVDSVGIITARSTIDAQGDVSIADKIVHTGDTNTAIRFPSADTIQFETGGSSRLQINSSGHTVAGGDLFADADLYMVDYLKHTGDTNTSIRFPAADTVTVETAGSERLRITSGGEVSIGGFTPTAGAGILQIGGGLRVAGSGSASDTTTPYIYRTSGVDNLNFATSGVERLRILSNGRVGVGTDSPLSVLTAYDENRGEGTATGQITAKDNAAYNASPTAGLVFQGHYANNNANAIFGGITGFKENATNGNYAGALAFHVRANGAVAYEALRITSTGIVNAPTQAGFYARMQNNKNNVMGGGASYYTVVFDTDSGSICYDQHNTYSTSTGLYTVPTGGDGHYMVSTAVCLSTDAYGRAGEAWFIVGSNRYFFDRKYFTSTSGTITGFYGTCHIKLTAGQTVGVQAFVSGGSTDVDVLGAAATDQITWFTARKIA